MKNESDPYRQKDGSICNKHVDDENGYPIKENSGAHRYTCRVVFNSIGKIYRTEQQQQLI